MLEAIAIFPSQAQQHPINSHICRNKQKITSMKMSQCACACVRCTKNVYFSHVHRVPANYLKMSEETRQKTRDFMFNLYWFGFDALWNEICIESQRVLCAVCVCCVNMNYRICAEREFNFEILPHDESFNLFGNRWRVLSDWIFFCFNELLLLLKLIFAVLITRFGLVDSKSN